VGGIGERDRRPIPTAERSAFRQPCVLTGRYVSLIPLEVGHAESLALAGADPEIWRFMLTGFRGAPEPMRELSMSLRERWAHGVALPFTTVWNSTRELIGMTRYDEIDRANETVEIGGTWITHRLRRTPVNTEAKLLMLRHAFETEAVHRVWLRTDVRNLRSQRAIERLGATREGVLREHLVMPDGYRRSSVYYGIVRSEWPVIRARLEGFLAQAWDPPAGSVVPGA
jgi:N-acetyltransferase